MIVTTPEKYNVVTRKLAFPSMCRSTPRPTRDCRLKDMAAVDFKYRPSASFIRCDTCRAIKLFTEIIQMCGLDEGELLRAWKHCVDSL